MKQESKTKALILAGYILVIILAGAGILTLYGELKKISEVSADTGSEEIITVSNVLSTLYEADNSGLYTFPPSARYPKCVYDSLMLKIKDDVFILKGKATDSVYLSKLDSVILLLDLKQRNENQMLLLMDSIMQLPVRQHQIMTTVLSQKDLSNIESVIRMRDMQIIDSTTLVVKKKSLLQKISDLFDRNAHDSISLNLVQKKEIVDSIVPIKFTTDTIAQYVTNYVSERNHRYSILVAKLSRRQFGLQQTNDVLLSKINYILKDLENKDAKAKQEIESSKKKVLADSAQISYLILIVTAFIVVFFVMLILQLINKQMKYQQELEVSKARTESLLVSKEQLMLAISHDIKAPLSSIIGFIEILSKVKLPEKEKYFIQNMQISSEQILELVNNLLDFHKLDSGKYMLNPINFSPYMFINDIYRSFVPVATFKSLKINLNNEIDSSKIYNSDPFRIKQIVNNLITNAIKFTREGSIDISAKIEKSKNREWFIVSVKDTGIGISQEDLKKLFERYKRAKHAESHRIEGFGLGLAISKKLANLLNGGIMVESKLDVGSTFTLKVPIFPAEAKSHKTQYEPDSINKEGLRLLLIDDDKVLLHVYSEMLKQLGYEVKMCYSSLKSLELLQNNKFDIVFCDIQMPDMNGFELVERIRNATFPKAKNIAVVALSARSDVSLTTYKEAGFTAFLPKPFTSQQLLSLIAELMDVENKALEKTEQKSNAGDSCFHSLIAFAEGDKDAAKLILNTFITENIQMLSKLEAALQSKDWITIQSLAHKLLPRMRMIEDKEIVSILYAVEKGEQSIEKLNAVLTMIENRNSEALKFIETL
ncbi:MAG: response regulator [Prevotellaceae bacterium]|jgi:signal transduction histidine kinase/FixJ family two-component response regulator|nr:response regulator [Prevotellaceae bacterium]